jgi:hypothetical protein
MAQQSWWQRVIAAIDHEYDRRIRAASLVTEYGAAHHGHTHEDEDEPAVITNIPKGTPIRRSDPPPPA